MLTRLSVLISRWMAARERLSYRIGGAVVGLLAGWAVLMAPGPVDLPDAAQRTAAVAVVMAVWWVGGVFPLAVTALVPLIAFPALALGSVADAARPFAHPLNFLMLGGFVLGHGIERVGLHKRLVGALLAPPWVRSSPRRVLLALMIVTASLSGIVSNTATTLMLLPVALALAARCAEGHQQSAFPLGLAYAASIGGVTTLVGTPPNAVLAQVAGDLAGVEVTFAAWMGVGVPFAVIALPIAWWVVSRVAIPLPTVPLTPIEAPARHEGIRGEGWVVAIVATAMALWMTRRGVDLGFIALPGWGGLFGDASLVHDAWVAILAAACLFVVPGGDDRPLLRWPDVERAVPWSVLLLLGGGFSLAFFISDSGLTGWLAGRAQVLGEIPAPLAVLGVCLGMTFLTELTSNTATTQIAAPLLVAAASQVGVDPMVWLVPATLSASCAFMMPVATAPNAIASEAGAVSPGDMALGGLVLNVVLAFVAAGTAWWLLPSAWLTS